VKQLPTIFELRGEAHALRDTARAAGKSLRHQVALNLVAKKYGFENWEQLANASEPQHLPSPDNPFLRALRRGTVTALWEPGLVVPCYWTERGGFYGKPNPLFELHTVQSLVRRFPRKFSMRMPDQVVLEQHEEGTFEAAAGYGPGYVMPQRTRHMGKELVLYSLMRERWSTVRANGENAKVLEQMARNYVAKYPAAAARHPEFFPAGPAVQVE
jgi:hypothetical protein